jgi:hypothetical protein
MTHTSGPTCPCEPRVKPIHGIETVMHKPFTSTAIVKRRKIAGLPKGWVIVGRHPSSDVMTEAQHKSEIEATEGAERRRKYALRKEANERMKRGIES